MSAEPYTVVLSQFSGPLDLLLHLVRKAEIDLKDIFVSEITEQYLAYVQALGDEDMERASDFLRTASLLLYIKSRALLPAKRAESEEGGDEEEEEDPEAAFIESLRLYEMYREAARALAEKDGDGANFFSKPPEEIYADSEEIEEFHGDSELLGRALVHLLEKRQKKKKAAKSIVEVKRDVWSISAQKARLAKFIAAAGSALFGDLFAEDAPTEEIVTTFAAMLELWSAGTLRLFQRDAFAPIEIVYAGDTDGAQEGAS